MLVALAHEEPHPVVDPLWHQNLVLPTSEQLQIQLRTH
jgi:hypothetical protein